MNNFQMVLEGDLEGLVPVADTLVSTIKIEILRPMSNYRSKKELASTYAERDLDGAIEEAKRQVLMKTSMGRLPIHLKYTAEFVKIAGNVVVFDVYIEGGDEKFLNELIMS